ATTSADGTVLLWDVASRKAIGSPLMVQPDVFVAGVMSRDGDYLYALPTGRSRIRLALSPAGWKRQACLIARPRPTARGSARAPRRRASPPGLARAGGGGAPPPRAGAPPPPAAGAGAPPGAAGPRPPGTPRPARAPPPGGAPRAGRRRGPRGAPPTGGGGAR